MKIESPIRDTQSGAVLFAALIIFAVVTVIGVAAIQTTTLEEKMAGNLRDQTLAFQAAEAALRAGESWLDAQTTEAVPQASCSSGCGTMVYRTNAYDVLSNALWETASVRTYAGTLQKVKTVPKYLIEYHSFVPDSLVVGRPSTGRVAYRLTARGTGGSDAARAVLQATYLKF